MSITGNSGSESHFQEFRREIRETLEIISEEGFNKKNNKRLTDEIKEYLRESESSGRISEKEKKKAYAIFNDYLDALHNDQPGEAAAVGRRINTIDPELESTLVHVLKD
jgi:hypothetical protein